MYVRRSAWTIIALLGLLLLAAAGCGGAKEYQEHALAEVCEAAEWGDHVQVSGILKLPATIIYRDGEYRLLLVEDLAQDQPWVGMNVKKGSGKNRMQPLADNYTFDDLAVRTADGRTVGHGDAVTVSGRYWSGCEMDVERIE